MKFKNYYVKFYEKANVKLVINGFTVFESNKFTNLSVDCFNADTDIDLNDDFFNSTHHNVKYFIVYVNDKAIYTRIFHTKTTAAVKHSETHINFKIKENEV